MENSNIQNIINVINYKLNTNYMPCNYFTGWEEWNEGSQYFNLLLGSNIASKQYDKKIEMLKTLDFIEDVEPNGVERVAILMKKENLNLEIFSNLANAYKVWELLGDIPIDEDENIDENFVLKEFEVEFEKGTSYFEIWYWIEKQFDISIGETFF